MLNFFALIILVVVFPPPSNRWPNFVSDDDLNASKIPNDNLNTAEHHHRHHHCSKKFPSGSNLAPHSNDSVNLQSLRTFVSGPNHQVALATVNANNLLTASLSPIDLCGANTVSTSWHPIYSNQNSRLHPFNMVQSNPIHFCQHPMNLIGPNNHKLVCPNDGDQLISSISSLTSAHSFVQTHLGGGPSHFYLDSYPSLISQQQQQHQQQQQQQMQSAVISSSLAWKYNLGVSNCITSPDFLNITSAFPEIWR